jgi:tRNA threonylcarbamoyladenosine biosynthesis protein TsaE
MTAHQWQYTSSSVAATIALGAHIGANLHTSDLILLTGGLGAGKTHLTKGIAQALGSTDTVTSPTYVFINEYRYPPRGTMFHIDLFRIEDPAELPSIGLDDALGGHGPCIIEWPERDPSLSTLPHLAIQITPHPADPEQRVIAFQAHGAAAKRLLDTIRTAVTTEEQP